MEKEIYCGRIVNANSENPFSPEGYNRLFEILDSGEWAAEISGSERASYFDGSFNYLNKRKTKGIDVFYSFEGKKISGKFTGSVKFVLNSNNQEKLSELEESIKDLLFLEKEVNLNTATENL